MSGDANRDRSQDKYCELEPRKIEVLDDQKLRALDQNSEFSFLVAVDKRGGIMAVYAQRAGKVTNAERGQRVWSLGLPMATFGASALSVAPPNGYGSMGPCATHRTTDPLGFFQHRGRGSDLLPQSAWWSME
jgi:hypothetical protein